MSEGIEEKKLTVCDFKNQVVQMVKAISDFDPSDRTEAFGYLQTCVKNLDFSKKNVIKLLENKNDANKIVEEQEGGKNETSTISDDELEFISNKCDLSNISEKDVLKKPKEVECESKCFSCGLVLFSLKELYSHGLEEHPGDAVSCKNCNKSFSNLQLYHMHIELKCCAAGNKRLSNLHCPYCDKKYQNFQHYSLHIEGHKRNKCEECGVHFNSRKILEEHSLNKHNKGLQKDLFECKFCDRKYAQKRSLLKHYKIMHNKDNNICLTCGKIFDTDTDRKNHEDTHVKNTFSCVSCSETFSRRQQYIVHLKEHNKYQCVTCNMSCPNKMKLEKHERDGHIIKGLPKEHQCSVCGSSFHFQSSLYFHKKIHLVSSEDHYGCEPCKRLFKNYQIYREHLLTEKHISLVNSAELSDQMPCKFCNKVFPNKRRLLKHVNKYHHKRKQVFQCDICDFQTHLETCLNKHMKLHTKKKEFICEKCGDSFYTKNALLGHINYVHNEERNFNCEKCGQTFKSASVLNRHMLCHNIERMYKCHCGQSYKFSGNLNRHQSVVHGKTPKSKRVKRLITDEIAILTSKISKNKKKQPPKEKQQTNNTTTTYTIINTQAAISLPFEQLIAQGNLILAGSQPETQMLQVGCHNLNFSADNRAQLVLSQNLDVATLHEVDTILQSEDSLKTTDTSETTDSAQQNIFGHLSDTDGNTFLEGESLIHPPIEPSLVTSFDDSSLNSVDHLETDPDHSNSQPHLQGLPEEPYYNIHFLDI